MLYYQFTSHALQLQVFDPLWKSLSCYPLSFDVLSRIEIHPIPVSSMRYLFTSHHPLFSSKLFTHFIGPYAYPCLAHPDYRSYPNLRHVCLFSWPLFCGFETIFWFVFPRGLLAAIIPIALTLIYMSNYYIHVQVLQFEISSRDGVFSSRWLR